MSKQIEVLKLALEYLEQRELAWNVQIAIRQALEQSAQQDSSWCMKMNGCKTKCGDCPDEVPKQPAQQEPEAGLRCKIIESCKSCQHSVGRLSCSLAGRDFDSLERASTPPEWCPLPIYTTPQAQPARQPLTDDQMRNVPRCVEALENYSQADEEGVMVLVSRQAIHETIDAYWARVKTCEELEAKLKEKNT